MSRGVISVVVPTYKRPHLLTRCLQALLNQKFPASHFEIIVVSDGPDETSAAAIEGLKNDTAIRYLALRQKSGPAAARNLGWKNSFADLIAFTDDDCIPDPEWLSNLYNCYSQEGFPAAAAFRGKTIVPTSKKPTDYEKNIANLETAEFITANCACTRKALDMVDGLDERFTMAWREDSDLQFKFLECGIPIHTVKTARVVHPVRQAPWGVCIKEEKKGLFNALLFKKYPSLYKQKIQPHPPWLYYAICLLLFAFLSGIIFNWSAIIVPAFMGWLLLTVLFTLKRLSGASHSWRHISEMFVTSAVIPLLSLYWRIYGCCKYKVLLFP